jgi:hypothetical protein
VAVLIHFLNADLDLTSADDLTALAAAFETRGMHALHVTLGEDGQWWAMFETNEYYEEPEQTIAVILDAVESFDPALHTIWQRCTRREIDIGYDCGDEPWAFNQALSSHLLGRMASAGLLLRITIYPDRETTSSD